jgi:hypothetical protein
MDSLRKSFSEFLQLGSNLKRRLPTEIRDAEDNDWDEAHLIPIRDSVEKYLRLSGAFARLFAIFAFVPLIVVILGLTLRKEWSLFYQGYAVYVSIIAGYAMTAFSPVVFIAPQVKRLPERHYHYLLKPLWLNFELVALFSNIALLAYIVPNWDLSATYPIFIFIAFIWLFLPWLAYLAKNVSLFLTIRVVQVALLIVFALVSVASPVPMRHYQWWAQREVAKKIRPTGQHELTADWEKLQWFTQEGIPNVWYSGDDEHGFRLYSSPGHDVETNEELKPVSDKETRSRIIARFIRAERAHEAQAQEEKGRQLRANEEADARAVAERARRAAENEQKLSDIAAAEARKATEAAEVQAQQRRDDAVRLAELYLCDGASASRGANQLAVVARMPHEVDSLLTEKLTGLLSSQKVPISRSVFKPAFFTSPQFERLMHGEAESDELFKPQEFARRILVVNIATTSGASAPANGVTMTTVDMDWRIVVLSVAERRVDELGVIRVRGIGFKTEDAEAMAYERALTVFSMRLPSVVVHLSGVK